MEMLTQKDSAVQMKAPVVLMPRCVRSTEVITALMTSVGVVHVAWVQKFSYLLVQCKRTLDLLALLCMPLVYQPLVAASIVCIQVYSCNIS